MRSHRSREEEPVTTHPAFWLRQSIPLNSR